MASKEEALRIIGAYFAERASEPMVLSNDDDATTRLTQACGLIDRFTPEGSAYRAARDKALKIVVVGAWDTRSTPTHLKKVEAILRGLQEDISKDRFALPTEMHTDALTRITHVLTRFHAVVRQLADRHGSDKPLTMRSEYDVQYLLHAILRVDFDDIRAEEWTPSHAGGSGKRMDFLLKQGGIVIEAKKTRSTLKAKEIGDQLLNDISHYRKYPECSTLVCLVYDPDQIIPNPAGMKADLESESTGTMRVVAVICQR